MLRSIVSMALRLAARDIIHVPAVLLARATLSADDKANEVAELH